MHTQFNTSSVKGGNTGSCSNLTNYLDKEQQNEWFNDKENGIKTNEVQKEIDRYGKGQLSKEDWKFVEVEYNPSQAEQQQIIYQATGRNDVKDWQQLSPQEKAKVKEEFANYVREAQDIQAKNYGRDNIKSGADLKYYGKIETQRRYKGTDKEVKQGNAKQGDLKQGLNLHAHIIQSRKAMDKKTKLAPTSKHKKRTSKNVIQQGFNRNEFYNKIEAKFDQKFNFNRDIKQTFEWKKANKLNRLETKQQLEQKAEKTHSQKRNELIAKSNNRPITHLQEIRQRDIEKERQQAQELKQEKKQDRGMGYGR